MQIDIGFGNLIVPNEVQYPNPAGIPAGGAAVYTRLRHGHSDDRFIVIPRKLVAN